jgi:glycosyltransferase involved in cell wall biosynthesis
VNAACIIPCFNLGEFLPQALESVFKQTRAFNEVLVVNDGSSDNTETVCDDYNVHCLTLANHGYSGARNAGVMNTDSDAILFLDADDWLFPTFLERTLPKLKEDDVGIVCTQVEADGVTVAGGVWPAPTQADVSVIRHRNSIWVSSLIRRCAFNQTGGFIPALEPAADWGLWVDIIDKGWQVASIHETLWHWRDRPEGLHMLIDPGDISSKLQQLYPHLYDLPHG